MSLTIGNMQDWATLAATVTGAYVAFGGLRAWRRETIGKRDIELCQTVIERFYEAEYKMSILRSPMSFSSEGSSRPRDSAETDIEAERRNHLFTPLARLEDQSEFWSELLSYKFRMKALFGDEASTAFDLIDESLRSFRSAAAMRNHRLRTNANAFNPDMQLKLEKIIWEGYDDNDKIAKSMKDATSKMEAICIPIVRSTSLKKQISHIWRNGLAGI